MNVVQITFLLIFAQNGIAFENDTHLSKCNFLQFIQETIGAKTVRLDGDLTPQLQGDWGGCHLASLCKKLNYEIKGLNVSYAKMIGINKYEKTIGFIDKFDCCNSIRELPTLNERKIKFSERFEVEIAKDGGTVHKDIETLSQWPAAIEDRHPLPLVDVFGRSLLITDRRARAIFLHELKDSLFDIWEHHLSTNEALARINPLFKRYFGEMEFSKISVKLRSSLKKAKIEEFRWSESFPNIPNNRKMIDRHQIVTRFDETGKPIKSISSSSFTFGEPPRDEISDKLPKYVETVRAYNREMMSKKIITKLGKGKPILMTADLSKQAQLLMESGGDLRRVDQLSSNIVWGPGADHHQMLVVGVRVEEGTDGKQWITHLEILNSSKNAEHVFLPFEKLKGAKVIFTDLSY